MLTVIARRSLQLRSRLPVYSVSRTLMTLQDHKVQLSYSIRVKYELKLALFSTQHTRLLKVKDVTARLNLTTTTA